MADGVYILETIADPDNRLLEAKENNCVAKCPADRSVQHVAQRGDSRARAPVRRADAVALAPTILQYYGMDA